MLNYVPKKERTESHNYKLTFYQSVLFFKKMQLSRIIVLDKGEKVKRTTALILPLFHF